MSEKHELSYGEVLRELRLYHDLKQKDISDYLNITTQAYSNYENGKRLPDIETMRKIAEFYGITIDRLINYRSEQRIEDAGNYGNNLYHGVNEKGISIPLTASQAKLVKDLLSLTQAQQDACQHLAELMKNPEA